MRGTFPTRKKLFLNNDHVFTGISETLAPAGVIFMKKFKIIRNLCLVFFLYILGVSCNSKSSDLELFFKKIDNTLTADERDKLLKSDNTDSIFAFGYANSNPKFRQLFIDLPDEISNKLDSAKVEEKHRYFLLIIAYAKAKNKKNIDFQEIEKEINIYEDKRERELQDYFSNVFNEKTKFAKLNYNKFNILDTICLTFPKGKYKGECEAEYRYPKESDELVHLTFVILGKEKFLTDSEHDEYFFDLKIIKYSHKPCYFMLEELKPDYKIKLGLFDYWREIEAGYCK
jgi:hypothetical protein